MRYLCISFSVLVVALLVSCSSKPQTQSETEVEQVVVPSDKVVEGTILEAGTSMNNLTLLTASGDTLSFSTVECHDDGLLIGEIKSGSIAQVAYMEGVEGDTTIQTAKSVVVISDLYGSWVEPNPIEQNSNQGVKIEENGVASSINMNTLTYKSWMISRGRLVLNSESEGSGSPIECSDTFNIAKISKDSLVLMSLDLTLRYGRRK